MFKNYKKYGKISDRSLGMFTMGLAVGCLITLLAAMGVMNYVFGLVLPHVN